MIKKLFFILTGLFIITGFIIGIANKNINSIILLPAGLLLIITGIKDFFNRTPLTERQIRKINLKILDYYISGKKPPERLLKVIKKNNKVLT